MKRSLIAILALAAAAAVSAQGTFTSSGTTNAATFGGTVSGFSSLDLGPSVNPLGFSVVATPTGGTGAARTESQVGALQAGFATLNATEGTQGGSFLMGGFSETVTSGVAAGASVYGAQAQNASSFEGVFTLPVVPVVNPLITLP